MEKKVNLVRGKDYKVELYPSEDVVDALYIGLADGYHIFSVCQEVSGRMLDGCLLAYNNQIYKNEKGHITHNSTFSLPIKFLAREESAKEDSELVSRLKEAGYFTD
jgi:hypothetical protein